MKIKAIALALLVAGFGASYALAGNGHGKPGDSTSTSTTTASHGKGHQAKACKPNVSFILNGTFDSAASDGSSFSMKVTHTNHHAKGLGNPATINVDAKTKIIRNGKAVALSALQAGDRLNVQARGCKNPPLGTQQTMVAKRVVAHPASSGGSDTSTGETTTSG